MDADCVAAVPRRRWLPRLRCRGGAARPRTTHEQLRDHTVRRLHGRRRVRGSDRRQRSRSRRGHELRPDLQRRRRCVATLRVALRAAEHEVDGADADRHGRAVPADRRHRQPSGRRHASFLISASRSARRASVPTRRASTTRPSSRSRVGGGFRVPITDHFGVRFDARASSRCSTRTAIIFCVSDAAAATCRIRAQVGHVPAVLGRSGRHGRVLSTIGPLRQPMLMLTVDERQQIVRRRTAARRAARRVAAARGGRVHRHHGRVRRRQVDAARI